MTVADIAVRGRKLSDKTSKRAIVKTAPPRQIDPTLQSVADELRKTFELGRAQLSDNFVAIVARMKEQYPHTPLTYLVNKLPAKSRYIHVSAKHLKFNLSASSNYPTIAIREASTPRDGGIYHHVEILGQSRLIYDAGAPMPDTEGRAICVIHTDAALLAVVDQLRGVLPVSNSC